MARQLEHPWHNRICNSSQIGGIETSVLDNGPGRGTRVAWIDTGAGFRCKVVLDRGMDIVDAFFNSASLAFLTHAGVTAPKPDTTRGIEWLYSFGGGLVTTCGLTHVGPPESDEFGERGLHGRVSNLPATVESVIQPDLPAGKLDFAITGLVKETRLFGPSLELRRTISGYIGMPWLHIEDEVSNVGTMPAPHMILYHCNFGYPLVDDGVDIVYKGNCKSRGMPMDDAIFNDHSNYRKCRKPMERHRGGQEACGFIDAAGDRKGTVTAGLVNRRLGIALVLCYNKRQLPCLANWQHFGFGDYVCALEPGTNFPIGQGVARKQKKLIQLEPGEHRHYSLDLAILTNPREINAFLRDCGYKK